MDIINEVETKAMQRTNLTWDNYIEYLVEAINESKFMRRAEIKPMSTPKAASESHVTSRATHLRMAADVAKRLAEGLDLNGDYIYAAMLMHDAGHPFSAHEGEEIFELIGQLNNCGFFHHNAKGVEVVRSEGIMRNAIDKIPNIKENPELRKKLEEEFDYFLDAIISHDGEASRSERRKKEDYYPTIKEAVKDKLTKSNSYDNYKFVAQTPEGKLAKMADVIAYSASDIQDGFRIGIINDFDDDYLALFGEMFTTGYSKEREEYITCAKNILKEIKNDRLRELKSDIENIQNRDILKDVHEIIEEAENKGIRLNSITNEQVDLITEIIDEKISKLRENESDLSEEERQFLNVDIEKLREFTGKMLTVNSGVVYDVTSRMKEYFINDILSNSQGLENAQFSKKGEKLFDAVKALNYKKIIINTKWDYQESKQPEAAKRLVDIVARSLINSGAIRNKFYDRAIRDQVPSEPLKYMKVKSVPEEDYMKYKNAIGLRTLKSSFRTLDERYTGETVRTHKHKLFRDVYSFVQKEGENFAIKYENVFNSIPTTVRIDVEQALEEEPKLKGFLKEYQEKKINKTRNVMITKYGTLENAEEHKEEFINELIETERKSMEMKMAKQLAIDYISGMTDRGFNDLAIRTGYMEHKDVLVSERSTKPSASVVALIEKNAREEKELQDSSEERS